uniref:Uncharacterized protein n=1 Tax=Arundo donax TaxID=35708 RepID=A0A0A9E979_ARUDO
MSSASPAPSPAPAAVSTASTAAKSPGTTTTPSSDPSAYSSRPATSSSSRVMWNPLPPRTPRSLLLF